MALVPAKCRTASSERYSLMTSVRPLFHASKLRHTVTAFGCSVIASLQARSPRVRVFVRDQSRPELVKRSLIVGEEPSLRELPLSIDLHRLCRDDIKVLPSRS